MIATKHITNTWRRRALAIAAVALLSVPSALGVFSALEPTRGPWGAASAAAGFELVYISTAILILTSELRHYARRVAIAAVAVAVLLNTTADYSHRVVGGLASWGALTTTFDPLALALALVESAPLAGLSYAMAELLHRLSGDAAPAAQDAEQPAPAWGGPVLVAQPALAWPREQPSYPAPESAAFRAVPVPDAENHEKAAPVASQPEKVYSCKRCGADGMTFAELGRHSRGCKG